MDRNYVAGESVYLPARFSPTHNAVLTATVIGVSCTDRKVTVRLANGTADIISFEELAEAAARVQRLWAE